MKKVTKHVTFNGSVQGVGFRFTVFNIANRLGLTGMVRNLPDGSVEMLAQGTENDVDSCIEDIKESFKNNITDLNVKHVTPDSKYDDFKITF